MRQPVGRQWGNEACPSPGETQQLRLQTTKDGPKKGENQETRRKKAAPDHRLSSWI
jgi:hypothetical protein